MSCQFALPWNQEQFQQLVCTKMAVVMVNFMYACVNNSPITLAWATHPAAIERLFAHGDSLSVSCLGNHVQQCVCVHVHTNTLFTVHRIGGWSQRDILYLLSLHFLIFAHSKTILFLYHSSTHIA